MSDEGEMRLDPPWTGPEVFAAFLVGLVAPALVFQALRSLGAFDALYGPELVGKAIPFKTVLPADPVAQARLLLWAVVFAFPFQIAGVLALLWQTARATPAMLGLTLGATEPRIPSRARTEAVEGIRLLEAGISVSALDTLDDQRPLRPVENSTSRSTPSIRRAILLALLVVPLCYGIQALCLWLLSLAGIKPEPHSFALLAKDGLSAVEWALLVFAACVVAPVWEELFFRGIVQQWVIGRKSDGELVALAAAVAFAVLSRLDLFHAAKGFDQRLIALMPVFCALALCSLHPLIPKQWRGLWASALLFAFVHSKAWPSPIPLIPLALVLGWLARRYGTLTGPILLHALFNGVACALLPWAS